MTGRLLVLSALAFGGCSGGLGWSLVGRMIEAEYPGTPTLTTDSLVARLASSAPPVLLDVRTADEFAVSHLAGAQRVEPGTDALHEAVAALPLDTPIVAYCSVGMRSAGLVQRLRAEGFTNVHNLDGSIFRWANEDRPVVRGDAAVRVVHPYNRTWGRLLDAEYHAYAPESQ